MTAAAESFGVQACISGTLGWKVLGCRVEGFRVQGLGWKVLGFRVSGGRF